MASINMSMKTNQNPSNLNDSSASTTDSGQGNLPSNNLWIGNVSSEVSESELKALFEKHGKVDSVTLYPGRNYAFMYFKGIEAAKAAKQRLQGYVLRGIPLKIEFAKSAKPCKSLWVAGISQSVSKEELEKEFSRFGKIQEFRFLRDRSTAYVNYIRLEDASQALKSMNGKQIGGDHIRVDFLRSHSSRRELGSDAREGPFPSRNLGPTDLRWMAQDSMQNYNEHNLNGSMREHQFISPGARQGDLQLTKVLWICHPPSVILEEEMLHNAMILFGEIEWIKILPDRHCAFVAFRSVEEARRAKEGLEGKLFNDPRISIEYSRSEPLPGKNYMSHFPGMKEHVRDLPFPPVQMDVLGHNLPILAHNNPGHLASLGIRGPDIYTRPLGPHTTFEPTLTHPEFVDMADFHKLQNPTPHALVGGPNLRRLSPTPGFVPSPSAVLKPSNRSSSDSWDVFDASQLQRESKRSRVDVPFPAYDTSFPLRKTERGGPDDPYVMGKLGISGASGSLGRIPSNGIGQRHTDSDYIWRGIIAKGGSPVCHARCVPMGEWVGSKIPEVINCSARTGLDMLGKHYEDAIGFNIVFFLPDSEEDFASYTEFLRYLGSKDRAGVAKFDDGTTMFLVPPSDFLTKVLKVAGPKRLYGVVLKFPQVQSDISSMNSQALQPPYVDSEQATSLHTGYAATPQEKKVVEKDYPRGLYKDSDVPPNTSVQLTSNTFPARSVPTINTAAASTAGVALTPELIATLASFLPANSSSYTEIASLPVTSLKQGGSTSKDTAVRDTGMAHWTHEHQSLEQTGHLVQQPSSQVTSVTSHSQHMPQARSLSTLSNMQNPFHQGATDYSQMHGGNMNLPPQGTVSSRQMASVLPSQSGSVVGDPEVDLQYQPGSSHNALMGLRVDHGTDALRLYNTSAAQQPLYPIPISNQVQDTGISQPHVMPQASQVEHTNQGQQIQSAPYGVTQESAESEADKNERYKSTLLFAANLLARIHQQPGNQAGPGAGSQ
ncbi:flowering time control protein FPA-like isoform X1 [Olea europaea var. sylvestris]|uniref:flowering time control protein FPA-like isoform X1 n=1 Tax=Olea europaea var. sylvestris TaxID=158386 RepID=UPI000C1CF228|nr:flowering time control protein FPA-like isoform X1 [Olea europaea var. sylvestris]